MPSLDRMREKRLSIERLREVLNYDPESGFFTLRVRMANVMPGTIVGRKGGYRGLYRDFQIDKTRFYLHRLAFLYMTGRWPEFEVDHKNTDKADNRWNNLRQATSGQNKANRVAKGRSGVKGVYATAARCRKPWESCVGKDGKVWRLGQFDTIEEAHAAYTAAATALHGEFARAA